MLRHVRDGDQRALAAFYAGLSPEAQRLRLLDTRSRLEAADIDRFCRPPALGLVAQPSGEMACRALIAHLCLEPTPSGALEVAVVVADGWQRRGIGSALLRMAARAARAAGVWTLVATTFAGNAAAFRLLEHVGLRYRARPSVGGLVAFSVHVPSVGQAARARRTQDGSPLATPDHALLPRTASVGSAL